VKPGNTYLFKGYDNATATFALLVRYHYADGSDELKFLRTYPETDTKWSTTSDAFTAPANLDSVQFVYRVYADGLLELNGLYMEEQQDVSVTAPASGINIVPNSGLTSGDYNSPDNWTTYRSGHNTATFSYQPDPGGNYVQAQTSDYVNGQAKWQYLPQPVEPDQYYQTSLSYRSDAPASLIAEYVLKDGQRQEQTIAYLPPADSWTTILYRFQTLPDATSMFLSVPMEHEGTMATRNYSLINITRPGMGHWQQPVVSVTFDDGWEQAYLNAGPLLKQNGYKATFYINPSTIETPDFMTADELTRLSNEGNEIAAHGYEHLDMTAINDGALDDQLHRGRDYLRQAGFQVTDFATPYGRSDAEVSWYTRKYFTTLRGTDSGINTLQNLDPYNLKVLYISGDTHPSDISAALQLARQYHGWLILDYHQVSNTPLDPGPPTVENPGITPATFKQQLALIHASGIQVAPVSAAYKLLQHQNQ
jgi:peptidoglycan/xylan/chitin deacetylase (PgdA/CDA1 family)